MVLKRALKMTLAGQLFTLKVVNHNSLTHLVAKKINFFKTNYPNQ